MQSQSETVREVDDDANLTIMAKKSLEITVTETSSKDTEGNGDQASPLEAGQYPTGLRFWLLMLNLGAVIILSSIDMSIVATAVPRITDHFHTVADVGWYSVAFRLCQCAFQFLFGKGYMLFSIKRVFVVANVFSFLGSLLCATAVTSTMLVVGRAVAGVGTAGLGAGANLMLVQAVPLRRRPMFLALWSAIEGTSQIAGPLIGGAITETAGWRWCFYINLPIGAATLVLTLLCFSEKAKPADVVQLNWKQKVLQLDIVSNMILVPGLTCLFLALSWAGTKYPWKSARVIGLIAAFAVLTGVFIYNQFRRGDGAALPLRVLKRRNVWTSLIFVTLCNSAGNVLEYYLPIYYQAVRGYTPAESGSLMLPILVAATLGAIGAGIGTSICGHYAPFMIFATVAMPIGTGLVTTFQYNTGLAKIIIYTGLCGLGYGVGAIGPGVAVQTVLSDGDVALGLAALTFGSSLGPAVFIAIAQVIFTNQLFSNLGRLIPGLGRASIESSGLTELVTQVPAAKAHDVLLGIGTSISHTYYLVVALACAMLIGSLPVEWRSVKKEDPNRGSEKESTTSEAVQKE